jgi:hypothetical protein
MGIIRSYPVPVTIDAFYNTNNNSTGKLEILEVSASFLSSPRHRKEMM